MLEYFNPFTRHNDSIKFASFSASGKLLVTCGKDKSVYLWNTLAPTNEPLELVDVLPHDEAVFQAVISDTGRFAVTSCGDGAARVWDLGKYRSIDVIRRPGFRNSRACQITADGAFAVVTFYRGKREPLPRGAWMSSFKGCVILLDLYGQIVFEVELSGKVDSCHISSEARVVALGLSAVVPAPQMATGNKIVLLSFSGLVIASFKDCCRFDQHCIRWDLSDSGRELALVSNDQQCIEVYESGPSDRWDERPIILSSPDVTPYFSLRFADHGRLVIAVVGTVNSSNAIRIFNVRTRGILLEIPAAFANHIIPITIEPRLRRVSTNSGEYEEVRTIYKETRGVRRAMLCTSQYELRSPASAYDSSHSMTYRQTGYQSPYRSDSGCSEHTRDPYHRPPPNLGTPKQESRPYGAPGGRRPLEPPGERRQDLGALLERGRRKRVLASPRPRNHNMTTDVESAKADEEMTPARRRSPTTTDGHTAPARNTLGSLESPESVVNKRPRARPTPTAPETHKPRDDPPMSFQPRAASPQVVETATPVGPVRPDIISEHVAHPAQPNPVDNSVQRTPAPVTETVQVCKRKPSSSPVKSSGVEPGHQEFTTAKKRVPEAGSLEPIAALPWQSEPTETSQVCKPQPSPNRIKSCSVEPRHREPTLTNDSVEEAGCLELSIMELRQSEPAETNEVCEPQSSSVLGKSSSIEPRLLEPAAAKGTVAEAGAPQLKAKDPRQPDPQSEPERLKRGRVQSSGGELSRPKPNGSDRISCEPIRLRLRLVKPRASSVVGTNPMEVQPSPPDASRLELIPAKGCPMELVPVDPRPAEASTALPQTADPESTMRDRPTPNDAVTAEPTLKPEATDDKPRQLSPQQSIPANLNPTKPSPTQANSTLCPLAEPERPESSEPNRARTCSSEPCHPEQRGGPAQPVSTTPILTEFDRSGTPAILSNQIEPNELDRTPVVPSMGGRNHVEFVPQRSAVKPIPMDPSIVEYIPTSHGPGKPSRTGHVPGPPILTTSTRLSAQGSPCARDPVQTELAPAPATRTRMSTRRISFMSTRNGRRAKPILPKPSDPSNACSGTPALEWFEREGSPEDNIPIAQLQRKAVPKRKRPARTKRRRAIVSNPVIGSRADANHEDSVVSSPSKPKGEKPPQGSTEPAMKPACSPMGRISPNVLSCPREEKCADAVRQSGGPDVMKTTEAEAEQLTLVGTSLYSLSMNVGSKDHFVAHPPALKASIEEGYEDEECIDGGFGGGPSDEEDLEKATVKNEAVPIQNPRPLPARTRLIGPPPIVQTPLIPPVKSSPRLSDAIAVKAENETADSTSSGSQAVLGVVEDKARFAFQKASDRETSSGIRCLTGARAFRTMAELVNAEFGWVGDREVARVVYGKTGTSNVCVEEMFVQAFCELFCGVQLLRRQRWGILFRESLPENEEALLVFHARDLLKQDVAREEYAKFPGWTDEAMDDMFEAEGSGMLVDLEAFVRAAERIVYGKPDERSIMR